MLRVVLFVLLSMLLGCASKTKILESLIESGHYEKAASKGQKWINDWGSEKRASTEGREIQYLIAKAELQQAIRNESYTALGQFRKKYGRQKRFRQLVADAFDEESQFYYRQVTLTHGRPADFQMFRRLYPKAPDTRTSKIQEVKVALQQAIKNHQIAGYRRFRRSYGAWNVAKEALLEATKREGDLWYKQRLLIKESIAAHRDFRKHYPNSTFIKDSRSRELVLAVKQVMKQNKVQDFRAFRAMYSDWSEAKELIKDIYRREATVALQDTIAKNTVGAFVAYRKAYPQPEWIDKADEAELRLAFQPIENALRRGSYPTAYAIRRFIARFTTHRFLKRAIQKHQEPLWKMLKKRPNVWGFRLFRSLYPKDKRYDIALKKEKDLLWEQANAKSQAAPYKDFLHWYPQDSRSIAAEERYYRLESLQNLSNRWPRAYIQSQRELGSGEIELMVDVRDCQRSRVSGLTKDLFHVFSGPDEQRITRFQGMEEERPIDLIFNLDMSGSMQTERNAVNQAIMHFVENFNFRNRRFRLGLIGFSEQINPKHRLSRSVKSFRKWMRNLPNNAGGAGEDAINAMVQSTKMLSQGKAERVVVLITDEELQVNKGGRQALGLGMSKNCRKMEKARTCLQRCQKNRNPYGCYPKCAKMMGSFYRRTYDSCMKRYRSYGRKRANSHCVRQVRWNDINRALRQCTEPVVGAYSEIMQATSKRMNRAKVRPFFLVPRGVSSEFNTLARATQGKVTYVPSNSRSPKPYINALMELSDQLSKQYIVRYKPSSKTAAQLSPKVLVQKKHIWKSVAKIPPGELVAMSQGITAGACPDLIAITRDKGIFRLHSCKDAWERIEQLKEHPLTAIDVGRYLVVLTEEGSLYKIDQSSKQITPVKLSGRKLAQLAAYQGKLYFLESSENKSWSLFQLDVESDKATALQHPNIPQTAATPLLFSTIMKAGESLCVQPNSKDRWCRTGETWSKQRTAGISSKALRAYGQVYSPPERRDVLLFAAASGVVYRSIDGGKKWKTSLRTNGRRPSVAFVPGRQKSVTCVSTDRAVHCSETAGLMWFNAGYKFEEPGSSVLASVNNELYVLQPGGLKRLDQVANRELPSSSVYFDTGADQPLPALRPFLKDIANTMRTDKKFELVIEGHADKRGSASSNKKLAARRAENVANYIVSHGVAKSRINIVSYGEKRPIRKDSSRSSLARNRRVELILTRRSTGQGLTVDPCYER